MTNNKLTDNQLTEIIKSAEAVITALAGTNDDVHPDNSTKMCRLWDTLNDDDAPPEVVLAMARELQERRKADSEAQSTLKRLAVILHGSEVDLNLLTVTAQSLVDRCKENNAPDGGCRFAGIDGQGEGIWEGFYASPQVYPKSTSLHLPQAGCQCVKCKSVRDFLEKERRK